MSRRWGQACAVWRYQPRVWGLAFWHDNVKNAGQTPWAELGAELGPMPWPGLCGRGLRRGPG